MGLLFSCELHFLTSLYAETFFNKVLFAFCIKKNFSLSTLFFGSFLTLCSIPGCCMFRNILHPAPCSGTPCILFRNTLHPVPEHPASRLFLLCCCCILHFFFFTILKVKSLFLIFFIIYNQQVIWFFQSSSETIREESLYLKNKCYFFHLIYLN